MREKVAKMEWFIPLSMLKSHGVNMCMFGFHHVVDATETTAGTLWQVTQQRQQQKQEWLHVLLVLQQIPHLFIDSDWHRALLYDNPTPLTCLFTLAMRSCCVVSVAW